MAPGELGKLAQSIGVLGGELGAAGLVGQLQEAVATAVLVVRSERVRRRGSRWQPRCVGAATSAASSTTSRTATSTHLASTLAAFASGLAAGPCRDDKRWWKVPRGEALPRRR